MIFGRNCMIRKEKKRQYSFLILLFAATLGVILTASFHEVRQKNADMLGRFVEMYSLDPDREERPGPAPVPEKRDPPLDQKPDFQLSTFYTVAIADDGSVLAVDNAGRNIYSSEELQELQPSIDLAVEIIRSFVLAGIDITMNQYNKLGKRGKVKREQ